MKIKTIKTEFLFNTEHILAPDGSKIKELAATDTASMVHYALFPGSISQAVRHKSVENYGSSLKEVGNFGGKSIVPS